jgi:hypothetical protein
MLICAVSSDFFKLDAMPVLCKNVPVGKIRAKSNAGVGIFTVDSPSGKRKRTLDWAEINPQIIKPIEAKIKINIIISILNFNCAKFLN